MKFKRLLFLTGALLQISLAAHAELGSIFTNVVPTMAVPRRASIIFIQCHGLAPGDLSCYGQTNYQTPNLDRLARDGIRFTHYSGGIESTNTTAMLLYGGTGVPAAGTANLAQRLRLSGYHTGLIGEWGLGGKPWTEGFDEFAGFLDDAAARNYYADHLWRFAPHSVFSPDGKTLTDFVGREMIYPNTGGKQGRFIPDLLVSAMANFARVNVPDFANHYRPFFLLVNLPAPRPASPASTGRDDFTVPTDAPFTGEPWPQAAKNRAALVTRIDDGIGRLFEQLDELKMTNNVAIFFSSSCAPAAFASTNMNFLLPKHGFRNQKSSVPPLLPMLAYWRGTIPAGQVSDHPWTAADFAPTAFEIGYVKPPENSPGHSILPVMEGRPPGKKPADSKP